MENNGPISGHSGRSGFFLVISKSHSVFESIFLA